MNLIAITLIAIISALPRIACADDEDNFVGTWTLEAIEERDEAGIWQRTEGRVGIDPFGYIIYDSAGNMAVQIMRRDRPGFASDDLQNATPVELNAAFLGYVAYFGTYEVNESEGYVTHHRIGHLEPNQVGTDAKRFYIFEGDTLTLMPNRDRRLRWKRQN